VIKKLLALCLCIPFTIYGVFEAQNDVRVEAGYRFDTLTHEGSYISSGTYLKQKLSDINLIQFNVIDRLTLSNGIFFQGLAGYGILLHAKDQFSTNGVPFFSSNFHYGHTWDFDGSIGKTFFLFDSFYVEPRVGYMFDNLKVKNCSLTEVQGPYIGIAIPLEYCPYRFTPDVSYMFYGIRNDKIDYTFVTPNFYLHTHHGSISAIKARLALDYTLECGIEAGLAWRYAY
jgi:hypothetical protein